MQRMMYQQKRVDDKFLGVESGRRPNRIESRSSLEVSRGPDPLPSRVAGRRD